MLYRVEGHRLESGAFPEPVVAGEKIICGERRAGCHL